MACGKRTKLFHILSSKQNLNCCFGSVTTFVVEVFITPAGRWPGAAAGPASLTLQSGLAQESVVV